MSLWSRIGIGRQRAGDGEYDYVARWRELWTAPVIIQGEARLPQARQTQPAKPELLRLSALDETYGSGRRRVRAGAPVSKDPGCPVPESPARGGRFGGSSRLRSSFALAVARRSPTSDACRYRAAIAFPPGMDSAGFIGLADARWAAGATCHASGRDLL